MFLKRVTGPNSNLHCSSGKHQQSTYLNSGEAQYGGVRYLHPMLSSTNYSPSKGTIGSSHHHQQHYSPSSPNKKLDQPYLKRFITNNRTSKVVKKDDIVIVNVDDDCAILQLIDFHLHGKMGRVVSISGDEVELEMIKDSSNDWIYIGNRVMVPIFCVCLEDRVLQSRLLS